MVKNGKVKAGSCWESNPWSLAHLSISALTTEYHHQATIGVPYNSYCRQLLLAFFLLFTL